MTLRCRGFPSPATKVLSISNMTHGLRLPALSMTSVALGQEVKVPLPRAPGRAGRAESWLFLGWEPGLGTWGHHCESGIPDQGLIWGLLLICGFPQRHKHICTRFLKKFGIQKRISNKSLSTSVSGGKFSSLFICLMLPTRVHR